MAAKKETEKIDSFIYNAVFDGQAFKEVLYLSGNIEDVVGISQDSFIKELINGKWINRVHPEDQQRLKRERRRVYEENLPSQITYRLLVGKKEILVEEKLFANKQHDQLFVTIQNVTEKKALEDGIRESEEKYRRIVEGSLAGVYRTHVDGTILDCNSAFAKVLGYSKVEDVLKLKVQDIYFNQKEREPYLKELKKKGTLRHYIAELKTKSGGRILVDNNVSITKDENGDLNIIEGTLIDITDQEESRQSLKNIVESSLASIFIFTDGQLVYKNPVANKLYNRYLNKGEKKAIKIFPKEHKKLIEELLDGREEDNSFNEIELGKNKEKSFSISRVNIVFNRKPSKLFLIRDISPQKEALSQKTRAELAETTNLKLKNEIENHKKTQEELVEKSSILSAFQESSRNLFIVTLDRKFRITSMNANFKSSMKKLLSKEVKEGDVFLDLFPKEDSAEQRIRTKFDNVFKGEPQEFISHFPTKTGSEFWIESFLNPITVGNKQVNEISCISHDITEKIQIQQQIEKSEASMRATLVAIPDFIFRIDNKGVFTDSRVGENLGPLLQFVSTSDFVGHSIREVFLNKKIAEEFETHLALALKSNGLHTHHFSFYIGEPEEGNKKFFENRFSKISSKEVVVISRDITEAMEYESRLVESVREKEVLLKEVHHRVKNNLQVINSILNLQSSYVSDAETLEIINESQNRIRSMSYIHESLYQTKDFNSINFKDYITTLVKNLVQSYDLVGKQTALQLNVQEVELGLDQAIPCGLILNELISNALKYAYPENMQRGSISISLLEKDNKIEVSVQDFGVGLPKDFKIEQSDSLGLSLVDTLVDQLDGELILERKKGTKFLIIFEKEEV